MMRYFLDTEFIEYPGTIDLISIALVAEDGREYYAENNEVSWSKASQWVLDNVVPQITGPMKSRSQIRDDILEFIGNDQPEFWGYYADYDWVVFCWLFGTMMDLPRTFPRYCRDIKQLCDSLGNPPLPKQAHDVHHALADASWNKRVYRFLQEKESSDAAWGF